MGNLMHLMGFPGGSDGKESACNAVDWGLIPRARRSPGEGNGYPLQYSCLENPMDRGAWQATVHRVAKSQTRPTLPYNKQLINGRAGIRIQDFYLQSQSA